MRRIVLLLSCLSSAAAAQDCGTYVGQTVPPLTFKQALAKVPNVAPKGEFETTAQYEARRAAASGAGPLVIGKRIEDRDKYIRYDADNARLGIQTYAFDNTGFDAWRALYDSGSQKPSTLSNYDVVISQAEVTTGSYPAQNGFGAKTTIAEITRTVEAIFQGPNDNYRQSSLFPGADETPYLAGALELPPETAQALKPTLKLAFVVEPREPYVIRKRHLSGGDVTIQNPREITVEATVLIADFQCGLVLDGANKVLGAFETR